MDSGGGVSLEGGVRDGVLIGYLKVPAVQVKLVMQVRS